MDPIVVPAPPSSAYNPNRRVSDLLLHQIRHFQHVERKRANLGGDLGIDPALARDVYTEAGAARYIAAMTRALRGKASAQRAKVVVIASGGATTRSPMATPGLALAAAADEVSDGPKTIAKKAGEKKATAKRNRRTK